MKALYYKVWKQLSTNVLPYHTSEYIIIALLKFNVDLQKKKKMKEKKQIIKKMNKLLV